MHLPILAFKLFKYIYLMPVPPVTRTSGTTKYIYNNIIIGMYILSIIMSIKCLENSNYIFYLTSSLGDSI